MIIMKVTANQTSAMWTWWNEQLPLNATRFEGVSKRKPKLPF